MTLPFFTDWELRSITGHLMPTVSVTISPETAKPATLDTGLAWIVIAIAVLGVLILSRLNMSSGR